MKAIHVPFGLISVVTALSLVLTAPLGRLVCSAGASDRGSNHGPTVASRIQEIEACILKQVNSERKRKGLKPLVLNSLLCDVARHHSADMANTGSLSHRNARGEDLSERLKKRGVDVLGKDRVFAPVGIAENIGLMPLGNVHPYGHVRYPQDVANAMMKKWMESPGHRANILNARYTSIGIGAAYDGEGTYYLTQDFK